MLYGFGMAGISPWSLLIILVIVVVIFGTKRLRNAGGDLGGAVKNFKDSMKTGENEVTAAKDAKKESIEKTTDDVIDATSKVKDSAKS